MSTNNQGGDMSRKKRNHFTDGVIETCDECSKVPLDKVLWQDKYKHLWCTVCWPYGRGTSDLKNWTKIDLARAIVKHYFKLDTYPSATDIRVKRSARNTKAVLMHRVEMIFNEMAAGV